MKTLVLTFFLILPIAVFAGQETDPLIGHWKYTESDTYPISVAIHRRGNAGAWVTKGSSYLFTIDRSKMKFVFSPDSERQPVNFKIKEGLLFITSKDSKTLIFEKQEAEQDG